MNKNITKFEEIQEIISNLITHEDNNPLFIDGFEGGLIGYNISESGYIQAVYSEEKMLEYWATENLKDYGSFEEAYENAIEFYEYNTVRSLPYLNLNDCPIIVHTVD